MKKIILGKSNELYGGQIIVYQNLNFKSEEIFAKKEKQFNAKLLYLFAVYNLNEKIIIYLMITHLINFL